MVLPIRVSGATEGVSGHHRIDDIERQVWIVRHVEFDDVVVVMTNKRSRFRGLNSAKCPRKEFSKVPLSQTTTPNRTQYHSLEYGIICDEQRRS